MCLRIGEFFDSYTVEDPEVFVAVCSRCGKRTMDPRVLLKLLDDFSPRRRRWMR